MPKALKDIFNNAFLEPIKKNLPAALAAVGVFAIVVGYLLSTAEGGLTSSVGQVILQCGAAALGAGVFAAVVKSAQFIEIFRRVLKEETPSLDAISGRVQSDVRAVVPSEERISALFREDVKAMAFAPDKHLSITQLKDKWLELTKAIFRRSLPQTHQVAAERIMEQFFDDELQYHFEDFVVHYEVHVPNGSTIAEIRNTVKARVVVSPNHERPIVTQTVTVGGNCRLTGLFINSKPIENMDKYLRKASGPDERVFDFPIEDFVSNFKPGGDRTLTLERTYEMTQDLVKEPYMLGMLSRFVKGCVVRVSVPDGYRVIFKATDSRAKVGPPSCDERLGFKHWVLAHSGELLLPGQGYIIFLVPES